MMPNQFEQKGETCGLPNREEELEAFVMGRLSEEKEEKIAAHVFECEQCLHELEFQNNLKQVINRMPAQTLAEVRPLLRFKGTIPNGRVWLAAAAIVLLTLGLYSSVRLLTPRFYAPAKLTHSDRDGLLSAIMRTDSVQAEQAFGAAAQAMLAAEGRHLGLWPYFDQEKAAQAIGHLRAAYAQSDDNFVRDECAYFLGKAFLMQANSDSACAWLNRVLDTPAQSYEAEADSLAQKLKCQ